MYHFCPTVIIVGGEKLDMQCSVLCVGRMLIIYRSYITYDLHAPNEYR